MLLRSFENYPVTSIPYDSVEKLVIANPAIRGGHNSLVFLINWGCGFGSALTVFIQNSYFLHLINPTIKVIPLFCKNTDHFKYHDSSLNNTFFRYFESKMIAGDINMKTQTIYFAHSVPIDSLPFFSAELPPIHHQPNDAYIGHFYDRFQLRIGQHITDYINTVRRPNIPLVGIHIRSIAQKQLHLQSYMVKDIKTRLREVKSALETDHVAYDVFIATDVSLYIDYAKAIFGEIHFIDSVSRIDNEGDSIPQLHDVGFKLGSDILYDCLALSLCDKTYVSKSNIPFIVSFINPSVHLIEY
jgi:hypothetical protein